MGKEAIEDKTLEVVLENFRWKRLKGPMLRLAEDLISRNLHPIPNFDLSRAFKRTSKENGFEIMSEDRRQGYVFCGKHNNENIKERMKKIQRKYDRIGSVCNSFVNPKKYFFGFYWRRF